MNDLLLRASVLGHATPGRRRSDHLVHRFAVCDGPACDAGTNFNGRIFSVHFQNLITEVYPLRFAGENGQEKYDRFFPSV
jgi:hypothetical protein